MITEDLVTQVSETKAELARVKAELAGIKETASALLDALEKVTPHAENLEERVDG